MLQLDDFKVEELEQRLEMGRWSGSARGGANSDGPYFEASVTFTF